MLALFVCTVWMLGFTLTFLTQFIHCAFVHDLDKAAFFMHKVK